MLHLYVCNSLIISKSCHAQEKISSDGQELVQLRLEKSSLRTEVAEVKLRIKSLQPNGRDYDESPMMENGCLDDEMVVPVEGQER